jgi:sugar/nucleoside kinase (ribokinase family)
MTAASPPVFGLIGTVSQDEIVYESGERFINMGGVLYQAAVLCGLGLKTRLHARLAEPLVRQVEELTKDWNTLQPEGLTHVPGPGNVVHLFYPGRGERIEILDSAVPALDPGSILRNLKQLSFLIMVINSGFELELSDWRRIVEAISCPVWLDIHSLSLEKVLGRPRAYRSIPEWRDWARGVAYVQANRQEVACMLGRPEKPAGAEEIRDFGRLSLDLGIEALFITLGREGALVRTCREEKMVVPRLEARVRDSTGCGDVFGAAAAASLSRGASPLEACRAGVDLASRAAQVAGIKDTYALALLYRAGTNHGSGDGG